VMADARPKCGHDGGAELFGDPGRRFGHRGYPSISSSELTSRGVP
jgi:hypothetical protein